ncbi:MAG: hypothetical protein EPO57_00170 [Chitinophagaceae bacterium]|nr:MAG: hypothetical protein EPO57_00170 [Chitinophagaceae bacterium]
MKKLLLVLSLACTSVLSFAQETPAAAPESKLAIGVDVVYPYLWRGIKLTSNKLAVQPYLSYAFTDKLTFGTWATTNLSGAADAYNEFDLYLSYQVSPVTKLMLSDYFYNPTKKSGGYRCNYFKYRDSVPRVMDLSVLFDFSEKGAPIDLQLNTIIYGNDYDAEGKRAFSTYAEIGYTHSFEGTGIDARAFVGAAVLNKDGCYGTDENDEAGFGITNLGLNLAKELKFSDKFSLPIFVCYTYNQFGWVNADDKTIHSFFSTGMSFTIK